MVSLVLLAAGAGSRFGGVKQLAPVGPGGETIMDYTIYDALRAGVTQVVLVIRPEAEPEFRETIGRRIERRVPVRYAHQRLADLPAGITPPTGRTKPWGTAHALLAAADFVSGPLVVANADDGYGSAVAKIVDEARRLAGKRRREAVLAAFPLRMTVWEGEVSRAICRAGTGGTLQHIEEYQRVRREAGGFVGEGPHGGATPLTGDEPVSMNLWAFGSGVFDELRQGFRAFLETADDLLTAECYLPTVVQQAMQRGRLSVRLIPVDEAWFGMTHPQDLARVRASLTRAVALGRYPTDLWSPALALTDQFDLPGPVRCTFPHDGGHINPTYVVVCEAADPIAPNRPGVERIDRFILQQINPRVFPDAEALMENMVRVTAHLRSKLAARGVGDVERRVLALVNTRAGGWVATFEGASWRMMRFVERARTLRKVNSPRCAYQAAAAFATFHADLADLPPPPLRETIPHFHDTALRLEKLEAAIERAEPDRQERARELIEQARRNVGLATLLVDMQRRGDVIVQTVHNDAKLSNILFDERTAEPLCLIDLDTTMPGLTLHDFGDMVRSMAATADEEETDVSKLHVNAALYNALADGFRTVHRDVTDEQLLAGARVIIYEQGARFLTDYLEGDQYYRTSREGQNLDRARNQFALLRSLDS